MAFFDYQDSDAKSKIHQFSIEQFFSSRYMPLEPLMDKM